MRSGGSSFFLPTPTSSTLKDDVFPTLLHLGHIVLPTYGLLAALGLVAALSLSLRSAPLCSLPPDNLWDAGLFALLAALLLSRLLLVLVNLRAFLTYPFLLLTVPSLTPLGLLLTALATLVYLRRKRLPHRLTLDAWAPCVTLLWAFLALGHFAEGSDPGLPSTLPFALAIPPVPIRLQPVSLYAAACALILTAFLLGRLRRPHQPGSTAALALVLAGLTQFLLTFLREPAPVGTPLGAYLDPLQWLGLFLLLAGALLALTLPGSSPLTPPERPISHAL